MAGPQLPTGGQRDAQRGPGQQVEWSTGGFGMASRFAVILRFFPAIVETEQWDFDNYEQLSAFHASTERDFDTVFATLVQLRAGALVIGADPFFADSNSSRH